MNLEQIVLNAMTRRSLPVLDERAVERRIARKVERVFDKLGVVKAVGVQSVVRCGGIVCYELGKYYVETGLVGIVLPKFGADHLPARLAGLWVN